MNALPLELDATERQWPAEIIVEPSRFGSRIWGEVEGDIPEAYCADIFPRVKTFLHEGRHFATLGCCFGHGDSCSAYPLIPTDSYHGPEPRQYTYEGRECLFRGRRFRLGTCVKFACRERTVEEWADLMRRKYAYGGYFAAGKSYAQVLEYFRAQHFVSPVELVAIQTESLRPDLPLTQEDMLELIAHGKPKPPSCAQLEMSM
jgi:hypothetical protein